MLIELWELLRGYRTWTETQGVIESAEVHRKPIGERGILFDVTAAQTMVWIDNTGQKHATQFVVPESSPLFSLKPGDAVIIRCHPAQPDRFYLRELSLTRTKTLLGNIFAGTCVVLLVVGYFLYHWAQIRYRRYLW
jgi:hypothetical protein